MSLPPENPPEPSSPTPEQQPASGAIAATVRVVEVDGPAGVEPTRYGDWERGGRCIDF